MCKSELEPQVSEAHCQSQSTSGIITGDTDDSYLSPQGRAKSSARHGSRHPAHDPWEEDPAIISLGKPGEVQCPGGSCWQGERPMAFTACSVSRFPGPCVGRTRLGGATADGFTYQDGVQTRVGGAYSPKANLVCCQEV